MPYVEGVFGDEVTQEKLRNASQSPVHRREALEVIKEKPAELKPPTLQTERRSKDFKISKSRPSYSVSRRETTLDLTSLIAGL